MTEHPDMDDKGSQDLFSSQSSSEQSLFREQLDITMQLTEYVWVQCDNPDCQKWRKVQTQSSNQLEEDSWYCSMNEDPERNTCAAAEEDTALYDRMARKAGIKYVMSTLEVGALVWAKVPGYCRWPGIISRCPDTGIHVWVDIDGDPTSYHVEFLGRPHSHCWVPTKFVEVYGHKNKDMSDTSQLLSQKQQNKKHLGRGKKRKSLLEGSQSKLRKMYKHTAIDELIVEADFFLKLTPQDRLNYIQFKYEPPPPLPNVAGTDPKTSLSKKKRQSSCSNCAHKEKRQKYLKQKSKISYHPAKGLQTGHLNYTQKQPSASTRTDVFAFRQAEENPTPRGPRQARTKKSMQDWARGETQKLDPNILKPKPNHSVFSSVLNSYARSEDEGISVASVKTEPSVSCGFDSPDQFSQSQLKFQNSMVDKTKEEKFTIDIGMYSKNEKAFEHDVRRFMARHGEKIRATPIWNNVPIRLFQLFLAVHERGGFEQVTKKKQWTSVYREVTEQHLAKSGLPAKKYYERNLYPYEMFISGKDFKPQTKKRNIEAINKPAPASKAMRKETEPKTFEILSDMDLESYTQDIEAILGQLDEEYHSVTEDEQKKAIITEELKAPEASKDLKKNEVAIKFHDESTDSPSFQFGSAASEFNFCPSVGSKAQEVPQMDSGDLSLASVEEKILYEMQALEKDMKEIIGHLDTEGKS